MKILELRFKNLNSLYGEWRIDFTDPEYVSNGIFALTGPTGAGKSTILDALCLALYGATPRLGKITKGGNEIMSRQTGECYAEVVFESQSGCFRCHWEQRRARKEAEGSLQEQEHQIAEAGGGAGGSGAGGGRLIESKKSLVGGVIAEKTGMDFERFTRSILLAQGGFDTFLKAGAEKKSGILEQITGSEIYSDISIRVHERRRDELEKLTVLQAETSGIAILEPAEEKALRGDLEARRKQETGLAETSARTSKAITWLNTIDNLKKELHGLADESAQLQGALEAFESERGRLEQATKAAALDGTYATLAAIRGQQADDQAALKAEQAALPELAAAAQVQAEGLQTAEQLSREARAGVEAAAPVIQRVRSLDQRLVELDGAAAEGAESCRREGARIEAGRQARGAAQARGAGARERLAGVEAYLAEHAGDEWLVGGLAGVEEQFGNLLGMEGAGAQKEVDVRGAESALVEAAKSLEGCSRQCGRSRGELEEAGAELRRGREALRELLGGRLLREYRAQKDGLLRELAYINKIEELEDLRGRLEDGKPCPLCGSTEHPYAAGNVPLPNEIEKKIESLNKQIGEAETQEAAIKKLEETEATARENLNNSEKLEASAAGDKKAAENALAELKDGRQKLRADSEELQQALSQKLQPLGITDMPAAQTADLLESLRSRLAAWQQQTSKKTEIEKQIAGIDGEAKRLEAVIETQSATLAEKQEGLAQLKKAHAAGSDERQKLYGGKNPDDEEARLNKLVVDADEFAKQARSRNSALAQKLAAAETQVGSLERRIEQRAAELAAAEAGFSQALEPAGFADEGRFLESRLANEAREALSARARELDSSHTQLTARQKDRETRLATETARNLTAETLTELEPRFKDCEQTLATLRDTIAATKHKLSENTTARERLKEKQAGIEAQKTECHRWEQLHKLIGSADGKKYRNFAQGLTFELMVSHANQQLAKMTDRYLLIPDDQHPLELNVVDNYQAGEIRSTRNLSGGESFIVSLTLALGLSKMASRKVRVDSLFLDEGFGTLDEDALETALETLSGLQQGGKLIGIISHVPALKERISTQINIRPVSGGRSSLTGPGCTKLT